MSGCGHLRFVGSGVGLLRRGLNNAFAARLPRRSPVNAAVDPGAVLFEGGQNVVVEGLRRRDRHLVREQSAPGMAAKAVDHGLGADPINALETPHHEGRR